MIPLIDQHSALAPGLPGAGLPWLDRLRAAGRDRFAGHGLPTVREEAWKYTSLRPLEKIALTAAAGDAPVPAGADAGLGLASHRLVLVNGRLRLTGPAPTPLPPGVSLSGLAAELAADPGRIESALGRLRPADGDPLPALNAAFLSDGVVLRVAAGVQLETPIELVFAANPGNGTPAWHPRLLVLLEPGSRATLIEDHRGSGEAVYLANTVAEISLGAGAGLDHVVVQREAPGAFHLAATTARLEAGARYQSFTLTLGARLARREVRAELAGAGAECHVSAAYLLEGRQHSDQTTVIAHQQPNGTSRQVVKGVIADRARAVFQGRIEVRPGAQKTDGYQLSRALLLSDEAEIDCKPELEIHADDVKCSHGATAGALDDEAMFYLRSRGVPPDQARALLIGAFVDEAIEEVAAEPVRAALRGLAAGWLQAREESSHA
jgi:Fe-S cluster assembly protein SufD